MVCNLTPSDTHTQTHLIYSISLVANYHNSIVHASIGMRRKISSSNSSSLRQSDPNDEKKKFHENTVIFLLWYACLNVDADNTTENLLADYQWREKKVYISLY